MRKINHNAPVAGRAGSIFAGGLAGGLVGALVGIVSVVGTLAAAGCGSSGDSGLDQPGAGLSPGGAQDFGRFKDILRARQLPGPETLDQVGFFNEHKIGEPPINCAGPVCSAAQLGSMANMISGSNCTLVRLSLGTPLDPQKLPRPAVDVAVAADPTGVAADLRRGLTVLRAGLRPGDTMTVLSGSGRLLASRLPVADPRLDAVFDAAVSGGPLPLYDALRLAMDTLGPATPTRHRRVIVVSDGRGPGLSPERTARLGRAFAEDGGGLTVISVGDAQKGDVRLLQSLADAGAGALYYASAARELPDLFQREVAYSLIPVAEQVSVRIAPGQPWQLREVFGIGQGRWSLDAFGGRIDIPALFVAWREVAQGGAGRRGGGGAILVEVLPRKGADPRQRPSQVAQIELSYAVPGVAERQQQMLTVVSPDGPGEVPSEGRFETGDVEKGFVVLNLYVALRMASQSAAVGDLSGALGVLLNIERGVNTWLTSRRFDPEIADDLGYVRLFIEILQQRGAAQQPPRSGWFNEPWPRD